MKLNIQLFAYTKKEWKDLPSKDTPILAADLNNIENGIGANDTTSDKNSESIKTNTANIETNTANIEANKLNITNLLTALGLDKDTWVSGTSYDVGDQVIKNYQIQQCNTANSDTIFTPSHWTVIPLLVPLVPQTTSTSAKANTLSEDE